MLKPSGPGEAVPGDDYHWGGVADKSPGAAVEGFTDVQLEVADVPGAEERRYERNLLLSARPHVGVRPEVGLPSVVAMPREVTISALPEEPAERAPRRRDRDREPRHGERCDQELDAFLSAPAIDAFAWDDEDQVDASVVQQSRGFSKWFGGPRRAAASSSDAPSNPGEAGVSTDVGSDGESSDEVESQQPLDMAAVAVELSPS